MVNQSLIMTSSVEQMLRTINREKNMLVVDDGEVWLIVSG